MPIQLRSTKHIMPSLSVQQCFGWSLGRMEDYVWHHEVHFALQTVLHWYTNPRTNNGRNMMCVAHLAPRNQSKSFSIVKYPSEKRHKVQSGWVTYDIRTAQGAESSLVILLDLSVSRVLPIIHTRSKPIQAFIAISQIDIEHTLTQSLKHVRTSCCESLNKPIIIKVKRYLKQNSIHK